MLRVKPNKFNNSHQPTVTKRFDSAKQFNLELNGYDFISHYYKNIPNRLSINKDGLEIHYQNVGANSTTVGDALSLGQTPDLSSLWQELATIANTNWSKTNSNGGTQLFYLDRLPRLFKPELKSLLSSNIHNYLPSIGNYKTKLESDFFTNIATGVQDFSLGICVPSQGDLHERNIFTSGAIVDFEGAGFNHIATDIATFLWHTLFAGNYFGPKYAKWASQETSQQLATKPKCFSIYSNNIKVNIDSSRQELVLQFVEYYINKLSVANHKTYLDQASLAISFRLLTTFILSKMSIEDQKLSLVFSHLFANTQMSLWEKLKFFIEPSEDLEKLF